MFHRLLWSVNIKVIAFTLRLFPQLEAVLRQQCAELRVIRIEPVRSSDLERVQEDPSGDLDASHSVLIFTGGFATNCERLEAGSDQRGHHLSIRGLCLHCTHAL